MPPMGAGSMGGPATGMGSMGPGGGAMPMRGMGKMGGGGPGAMGPSGNMEEMMKKMGRMGGMAGGPPASSASGLPEGGGMKMGMMGRGGSGTVTASEGALGYVMETDSKTGLVAISIGTDSGIRTGSQLEVYRLKPTPKYLGKLEIIQAQENRAVGRTIGGVRGLIETDDLVAGRVIGTSGGSSAGTELDSAWAENFFEQKSWDFGSLRRRQVVGHDFWVSNKLDKPIHIAAVRTSAAFVTPRLVVTRDSGAEASVDDAWISPHQSAKVSVQVDNGRFVGDKTANIYVFFDQPSAAEVKLQVHARGLDSPAGGTLPSVGTSAGEESKAKILELEQKVDQLMKQIDALPDVLHKRALLPARP